MASDWASIRQQQNENPDINSCLFCNQPERNHGMTSAGSVGLHYWVEPSNEVRKQRLKANREARQK